MISNEIDFLDQFSSGLKEELKKVASIKLFAKNTEILRHGQFVGVVPIVLEGLIKVSAPHEDKDLLLYYIKPSETCIMSFSSALKNEPSKIIAITENDCKLLLLPSEKLSFWMRKFPEINLLFFDQYNQRYGEFIDTLNHVVFDKLDKRIFNYLHEKMTLTQTNPIPISHREIANELGTAREVVSRVLKKLETESKIKQLSKHIEILDL